MRFFQKDLVFDFIKLENSLLFFIINKNYCFIKLIFNSPYIFFLKLLITNNLYLVLNFEEIKFLSFMDNIFVLIFLKHNINVLTKYCRM